jgi:hypothetical protein
MQQVVELSLHAFAAAEGLRRQIASFVSATATAALVTWWLG